MSIFSLVVALLFVATHTFVGVASADESIDIDSDAFMTPIDSEFSQNVSKIDIAQWCYEMCCCTCTTPNPMVTIFPSNDGRVTVETSPANLVTATTYDSTDTIDTLFITWNKDVASTCTTNTNSGSVVRIGVPRNQLLGVRASALNQYDPNDQTSIVLRVQVVDGFTNLAYLSSWGSGVVLRASMTSLVSTELELYNYRGQMNVHTNVPVTYGIVSKGGQSWVETPSFKNVDVAGDQSQLTIKGDVVDGGTVRDGARLTVTGTITGGSMKTSDHGSTVNAPSCDNVTSHDGSICTAGPQRFDVDASIFGKGCSASSSSSSAAPYYSNVLFIAAAGIALLIRYITIVFYRYTTKKT